MKILRISGFFSGRADDTGCTRRSVARPGGHRVISATYPPEISMEGRTGVPVMADAEPQTSKTLLSRLHTWRDQTAWRQFFAAYQPLLDRWARTSLRNPADVQDLTQTLWFELARRVRSFQYDSSGSFRGWLRSLYRSRLSDFLKSEERRRTRERMAAQPALELTASCLSFQTDRSEQTERSRQAARWQKNHCGFRLRFAKRSL